MIRVCDFMHANNKQLCFNILMAKWKWQSFYIVIPFIVPLFMGVVIRFKSIGLNQKIICIYNKHHSLSWNHVWMWLCVISFWEYKVCNYFLKFLLLEDKMIKRGQIMCIIAYHVIFSYWWPNWPILGVNLYWIMLYVVWEIYEGRYYVNLWSMFERLAYGVSYASIGWSTNCKWFCFWCINIDLGIYSYS